MSTARTIKQQHNGTIRAACYLRISSDPNDKREGVDRQREDTAILCEAKDWAVAGLYVDNNRSASNGKQRPEWERLLQDIEAGKIDAVAAWDQDRQWRKMAEFEEIRRFFYGLPREIPLATTGQGDLDLYSPTGVLTMQIKTAVSEHEIAMMRGRQLRAARQRAEHGVRRWTKAFGYREGINGIEVDPDTAPLVRKAYRQILAGASLNDIARLFNEGGHYGLHGKPWTASTVSLFMRSARNAGLRSHNDVLVHDPDGNIVRGDWPGLVAANLWHEAQAVLNAPGRKPGKKVHRYMLTGALRCGRCAKGVGKLGGTWAAPKADGLHRVTYTCRQCHGVSIRAQHVEPILYRLIGERLAMPDAVDLLKAERHDVDNAERIRAELATLYSRLASIGVDVGEGLLTGQQAKTATDVVNAKIAALVALQHDSERLRVFEGIPLGTPEAVDKVHALSHSRFRAVMNTLMEVTILPVGRGRHGFDPEDRIDVVWK
jgi:DNA invertase Pin-like site-specific DNA recombinase